MKRAAAAEGEAAATFERFQQFARRLFAVPKKEIDEKLAEYRRRSRRKQPTGKR